MKLEIFKIFKNRIKSFDGINVSKKLSVQKSSQVLCVFFFFFFFCSKETILFCEVMKSYMHELQRAPWKENKVNCHTKTKPTSDKKHHNK